MQFKLANKILLGFSLIGLFTLIGLVGCDSEGSTKSCEDGGTVCSGGELCVDKACLAICTNVSSCGDTQACVDSLCREYEASCSEESPCATGWFCNGDALCERLIRIGTSCSDDASCELGFCVDGVCCTDACDGACVSCANEFTGTNQGMCASVISGQDPKDDCDGSLACNGSGQCFGKANNTACENDFECLSGRCIESLCRDSLCGDGQIDGDEACDDGNTLYGDYCSADCSMVIGACGDNVQQSNEACDDGNTSNGDYCSGDCLTILGFCGDTTTQANEACDDGNTSDGDYCSGDCSTILGFCGDSTTQSNEACDDGNTSDGDYCSGDCLTVLGFCGDSAIQANEICDDGNTASGDYCSGDCLTVLGSCSDGTTQGNEACDDGNTSGGDYCSADCLTSTGFCGDAIVQNNEACDDGDSLDGGNGCSGNCLQNNLCGDGVIETVFEDCDDGEQNAGDGCSAQCGTEPRWGCFGQPSMCVPVIRVNRNSTHPSPTGDTWATALPTLGDAIEQANAGDQIWVAWGKYYPTNYYRDDNGVGLIETQSSGDSREKTFGLKDGVALYGGFDGTESKLSQRDWIANPTTLHGNIDSATDPLDGNVNNNAYHVVSGIGVGASTVLDGFIIEAGAGSQGGDDKKNGAGMWLQGSGPVIANTVFKSNLALSGSGYGGALYLDASSPAIVNSTFTGNQSYTGAAIFADNGSDFTLSLSTVVDNTYSAIGVTGAVIYMLGGSTGTISNSVFWQCAGVSIEGCSVKFFSGSGLSTTDSCIEGATVDAVNNITFGPLEGSPFVNPGWRDFRLSEGISFRDYGDNAKIPNDLTDMDGDGVRDELIPFDGQGLPRIVSGAVDFGAFELQ